MRIREVTSENRSDKTDQRRWPTLSSVALAALAVTAAIAPSAAQARVITVGVIDTGIGGAPRGRTAKLPGVRLSQTIPSLRLDGGKLALGGGRDRVGHGTMIANTTLQTYSRICRRINTPACRTNRLRFVPLQVMDKAYDSSLSYEPMIKAFQYAAYNHLDVVTYSLAGDLDQRSAQYYPMVNAINSATAAGVNVVVSAGNGGPSGVNALASGVLGAAETVAATTSNAVQKTYGLYSKSTRGTNVARIAGPGVSFAQPLIGSHDSETVAGTSVTTAVIAGGMAAVRGEVAGTIDPMNIRTAIETTAFARPFLAGQVLSGRAADVRTMAAAALAVG